MDDRPIKKIILAQVIGRLDGGGAQRLAVNLGKALDALEDLSCVMIALREGGGFVENDQRDYQSYVLGIDPGSALSLLRGGLAFRKLIKRLDVDILHVHGADCLPFCDVALIGIHQRPKLVFTWHDSEKVLQSSGWRSKTMLWCLRRCQRIYGSSRTVASRLASALNRPGAVSIFVNGVPTVPERKKNPGKVPHIIWVGRIVPPKAPLVLIEAAAELKKEGLPFRITLIGDSPPQLKGYFETIREKIDEYGLKQKVKMAGWVENINPVLEGADIAVQTSLTEGLSMALLEQMMGGIAIVATDVGDTAEALDHGRCGLLYPPGDQTAMINCLRSLLIHSEQRYRIGQAARQRALQYYSLEAMAERAQQDYLEIIDK